MDANNITFPKFCQAFRDFVFKPVFLVGLIMGFILGMVVSSIFSQGESTIWSFIWGIVAGYCSNYLWESQKKKRRGEKPYLMTTTSHNNIFVEGQFPQTESNKNTFLTFQSDLDNF